MKIREVGSAVKKGEIVCELGTSKLRDQLIDQQIATSSAKANSENAALNREIAEIAVVEYVEGVLASEKAEIRSDVKLAEAELELAEAELGAVKASDRNQNTLSTKRAEVAVLRSRLALEKTQARLRIVNDYTGPKRTSELKSELEKARSSERSMRATFQREVAKEQKIEKQIAACTIRAPLDGMLGSVHNLGTFVGEGQLLFEIVAPVKAKSGAH